MDNVPASSPIRQHILSGIGVALCALVLCEVNRPTLLPQGQLAMFALLGICYLFLSVPLSERWRDSAWQKAVDHSLAVLAVVSFGYVFVQVQPLFQALWIDGESIGGRAGSETGIDVLFGTLALLIALEAARRTVGWTLPILTVLFLLYARFGRTMPDWLFPHGGFDWARVTVRSGLQNLGIYGVALYVMFSYVFPFVLFGAVLERTGATRFIIDLARRLFRNSPGGPAKVAVLSSGMMGSLSGSAVANTATTGTFTIPMMKSSGFSPHAAAGVEAAASSGGALMPPIMGAGAYMMLEMVEPSVTYLQIIRAAAIPAILYYFSLLLVVHFHSKRIGATDAADAEPEKIILSRPRAIICAIAFGSLLVALLYGYSPARAVSLSLLAILLAAQSQRATRLNWQDIGIAARKSAQGGVSLIAATACVGVILGVVTLTGIGARLPSVLLPVAQDSMGAALVLLMVSTIILGMGLPSAVCYLLMATFVGPVLGNMGIEPLAAHLFIFYFGMMSMVTPPVALAAYTAAAISEAPIMQTAACAFLFALTGFILPYAFVLHPSLLLIPEENGLLWPALENIVACAFGVLLLAVAVTGYCCRLVPAGARGILALAAICLIVPPGPAPLLVRCLAASLGLFLLLFLRIAPPPAPYRDGHSV